MTITFDKINQTLDADMNEKKAEEAMLDEFKREDRYIVIKRSDFEKAGSQELSAFHNANHNLRKSLMGNGAIDRSYLVIESDWPEYEPVWAMIEARMTAATVPPAGDVEVLGYLWKTWHDLEPQVGARIASRGSEPDFVVELVDHAHVTRLTAERDAFKAENRALKVAVAAYEEATRIKASFYDQECEAHKRTQSELTKARELLNQDRIAFDTCTNMAKQSSRIAWYDKYLLPAKNRLREYFDAHQPAPAAKGEGK